MKILSVNVSLPRAVQINGKDVLTGIYKEEHAGRIRVGKLGLAGDGQADHTVHGGEYQALYGYPFEHYAHWQTVFGGAAFPFGTFGENLTFSGLLETDVFVGDLLRVGSAILQVTMPRLPCYKLGHKLGRPAILKEFLHSGYSGYYFRVAQEGEIGAGDAAEWVRRDPREISIRTLLGLQRFDEGDEALVRRTLEIESLGPSARRDLEARLAA
jgi:MOSC domain-containing protein YiiM